MLYHFVIGTSNSNRISKIFLYPILLFLFSLIPAVGISLINFIPFSVILNWTLSFLMLPFLYYYVKGSNLTIDNFIQAGTIFAIIVITLFLGRLFEIGLILEMNDYIMARSNGFFGNKNFLSGDILPNVYFQGTLSLIITGALSLKYRNYLNFVIILLALIIAPSRFGFLLLVFWLLFVLITKNIRYILFLPFILFILFIILIQLPFGKELFSIFTGEADSLSIRNGHFVSISNIFIKNPISLIFGQGPGSIFYTSGIDSITDNIEISQLEFIRKYGLISFTFFCVLYFRPFLFKFNNSKFYKGTLLLYFVVSFSNPVLFSIFSMLFLTFVYVIIEKNNLNPSHVKV